MVKTLTGNPNLVNPGFNEPPHNPLYLLQHWLKEAARFNVKEPNGLVLSTNNGEGKPSSRVVLLKTVDDTGIIFASSLKSKKGMDISNNFAVAGTLWWRETMQHINFMGYATESPLSVSDAIWKERTREAQAVASISHQSAPMVDEEFMRNAVMDLMNSGTAILRSKTWVAYHIAIHEIEFWHGSQDRFHNRLRYNLINNIWHHQKLQP